MIIKNYFFIYFWLHLNWLNVDQLLSFHIFHESAVSIQSWNNHNIAFTSLLWLIMPWIYLFSKAVIDNLWVLQKLMEPEMLYISTSIWVQWTPIPGLNLLCPSFCKIAIQSKRNETKGTLFWPIPIFTLGKFRTHKPNSILRI